MDQPVDLFADTAVAFIGRALRGPLNTPVLIDSMTAFARRFGGVWHRSSLGHAVGQFFAHGGRALYVVRVANNARGAMICLPARHGVLVLRALEPGSTERVRAAVDYDGIADNDETHFNLTLQRVSPLTGLVIDQEIYRRISCDEASRAFLGEALMTSSLVGLQLPLPSGRPLATMGRGVDSRSLYVDHVQHGSDGAELSDYDLIGSASAGTGLFALDRLGQLDLLYLPPPARQRDVGPAALLAAERYCRGRGAMLVMDPPQSWSSAREALAGVRHAGYGSANMLSYFPRLVARGAPPAEARAAGGALAGLMCRLDASIGPWAGFERPACAFRHELRPAVEVRSNDADALNRAGLNVVLAAHGGRAGLQGSVTLARRLESDRHCGVLPARRLCLRITNAIERATRWAVFETADAGVAERVRKQVEACMALLAEAGAFADERFHVQCDLVPPLPPVQPLRSLTVLLTFRPPGCSEPVSLTLHHTVAGCRVASTAFAPVIAECA